jgi:hypothetical protein
MCIKMRNSINKRKRKVNERCSSKHENGGTGRPRLMNVRHTNIRTYEQATDVHSPGPENSCSRYEHGYRHVVTRARVPNKWLTNGNFEHNAFVRWDPLYVVNMYKNKLRKKELINN